MSGFFYAVVVVCGVTIAILDVPRVSICAPLPNPSKESWKKFLFWESCANFLEWLVELGEDSWKFPRSLRSLSLTHTCPVCLSILFHTGDIQALGKCTQLTSVNFFDCMKITGGCCFEERSFSRLRPSPLFLGEHSLQKNPRTSTNGSQQFKSINQLLHAGDIQVLASCPNLTEVYMECTKVEGTNERLNVSALF